MTKRPVAPCKECEKHTGTCHGTCEEYGKYAKENEAYLEEIRAVRSKDSVRNQYVSDRRRRKKK